MRGFLSLAALCLFMAACSSSNNDSTPNDNPPSNLKGDLDPTANTLDYPPTGGNLPADLRPPV